MDTKLPSWSRYLSITFCRDPDDGDYISICDHSPAGWDMEADADPERNLPIEPWMGLELLTEVLESIKSPCAPPGPLAGALDAAQRTALRALLSPHAPEAALQRALG